MSNFEDFSDLVLKVNEAGYIIESITAFMRYYTELYRFHNPALFYDDLAFALNNGVIREA